MSVRNAGNIKQGEPKEGADTRFEGALQLREEGKHKKHYFVLAGPSLYCFKKDTDTEPKTIFYLTDWTVQGVEGSKHKHLIHLIRERPLTQVEELLANSADEKTAWMNALMKEKNKILAARVVRPAAAASDGSLSVSNPQDQVADVVLQKLTRTDSVAEEARPPPPPYTRDSAMTKVRLAEDGWNSRDPARVSLAYTKDSKWRNRGEIFQGRERIVEFLTRKWKKELDYRLIKELWAFDENKIGVRFAYEWRDDKGQWYRSYGNEMWEFNEMGLMKNRHASINDILISEEQRLFRWPTEKRPDDHPGLTALGL